MTYAKVVLVRRVLGPGKQGTMTISTMAVMVLSALWALGTGVRVQAESHEFNVPQPAAVSKSVSSIRDADRVVAWSSGHPGRRHPIRMLAERAAHPCPIARSITVQRVTQVFLYGIAKTPSK